MENKARELGLQYGRILQQWLFPRLEEERGPLTEKHEQLVRVLGWVEIEKEVGGSEGRVGRPRRDRGAMSRAFAEFARTELPQRVHQALIRKTQQERLIGPISRDATAIVARERVAKVENAPAKKQLPVRRKRGAPQ